MKTDFSVVAPNVIMYVVKKQNLGNHNKINNLYIKCKFSGGKIVWEINESSEFVYFSASTCLFFGLSRRTYT